MKWPWVSRKKCEVLAIMDRMQAETLREEVRAMIRQYKDAADALQAARAEVAALREKNDALTRQLADAAKAAEALASTLDGCAKKKTIAGSTWWVTYPNTGGTSPINLCYDGTASPVAGVTSGVNPNGSPA